MIRTSEPILVCFAVPQEAQGFTAFARRRADIEVLVTGMGGRNAEKSLSARLAGGHPRLLVSAGFAGGLAPDIKAGEVLFSAPEQPVLAGALEAAGARAARFYCAERVASTVAQKQRLREQTGADAVEMESGVLCAAACRQGIPSATVRVVLDTALEDLPLDFNALMTAEQKLDGGKLALALLKSPGKIAALLRLQKESKAAALRLGAVLEQALGRGV